MAVDNYLLIGLLIVCCFAAGWIGGYLKSWGLVRVSVDLDYRLTDLEGRVNREVKIRAGQETQRKRNVDQDLQNWAVEAAGKPEKPQGVSVLPFPEWYRSKMKGGK